MHVLSFPQPLHAQMLAKMTAAPGQDNFEDEGARYKRQRMSSPSPAPTVVSNPFDAVAGTTAELLPTIEEYPVHTQQQCRIFQLPFELREMIYGMACVNDWSRVEVERVATSDHKVVLLPEDGLSFEAR